MIKEFFFEIASSDKIFAAGLNLHEKKRIFTRL